MIPPEQISFVGLRIDAAGGGKPRALLSGDLNADLIRDCARDVALELQHIRQITLVIVRPQMRIRRRVNQLRRHPHAPTGPLHCSFDHCIHIQFMRDLWEQLAGPFVTYD